eukprot:425009_1
METNWASQEWTELDAPIWERAIDESSARGADITQLNHDTLIYASNTPKRDNKFISGIYIYFVHLKKWELLIKYPQDLIINNHQISYDKKRNKLYMYDKFRIIIVNIESKKFEIYTPTQMVYSGVMADVGDDIHIIGASLHFNDTSDMSPALASVMEDEYITDKHYIYNKDSQKLTNVELKRVLPIKIAEWVVDSLLPKSLIYVPSKNCLILFMSTRQKVCYLVYSLQTQKWEIIRNLKFDSYGVAQFCNPLLLMDEQHIIILGYKWDDEENWKRIYIMDISNDKKYVLKKTHIYLPTKGKWGSQRDPEILGLSGGAKIGEFEKTAFGFIRREFKEYKWKMPSNDIMRLFIIFVGSEELLHYIEHDGRKGNNKSDHYVISTTSLTKANSHHIFAKIRQFQKRLFS